jgi:hypothetical protein
MQLNATLMNGRLPRRILILFIISTLIPLLVLAALYRFQVNTLLLEQTETELDAASSAYASVLYDRLLLADDVLRKAASDLRRGVPLRSVREQASSSFSDLALSSDAQNVVPGISLTSADLAHIQSGRAALLHSAPEDVPAAIILSRAVDPDIADSPLLFAEIRPEYLWAERDSVPYLTGAHRESCERQSGLGRWAS